MPHVALAPLTGLRVREAELLELGMSLPGLRRRASALAELPALGLLTLAGMTPPDWTVSYHDAARPDEALVERIVAQRPTLVALSALTASIDEAYGLAGALRARGLKTVLGGLHATACPDEAARHVDAVVVGEGEPVWHEVLADAAAGSLGGLYRAARPFDLAFAPVPRWDLLGSRPRPRFTLQTERGCPLACDFCGASRLLGRFREKRIAAIRRELAALVTHAPRPWLELADDNTWAGSRAPDELFGALAEADVRYFTEADWRIGERPELLAGLATSGCVQVLVGLESAVFRYPGMGGKQAAPTRMLDAVRAIQEAGVAVNGCVILGADGETPASLDRVTQFLLDSPLAEIQVTLQTPFPGTALYQRLSESGRLLPDIGWSSYTLFDVTYQPDSMSVGELRRGFRDVLQAVFAPAASARRVELRRKILRGKTDLP